MEAKQAYNIWAEQYDTNHNKTRDLEAISLRENLSIIQFETCLEIGCGTGKNTEWLITQANNVLAIDISEEMLAKAKEKIKSPKATFQLADITTPWAFADRQYDLIGFSLVLEHIENLDFIFCQVAEVIAKGGYVYLGELHPFKQYAGTKARFETEEGIQIVTCFNHNISDFTQIAQKHGFEIVSLNEYFDDNDRNAIPRILTILFKKV